jgi:DNA integrity scanning protein DisA with diadenylate cyclase activity
MEKEKAVKASEILAKINQAEKRLKIFENTKEFCEIKFRGENGAEVEHEFSYKNDNDEVKLIRDYVHNLLKMKIAKLMDELNAL